MSSEESERRARAEARRSRMILHKSKVGAPEVDLSPLSGPEALSLVTQLTIQCWALSSRELPTYVRADTPYEFVPRRR